RRLAAGSLPRQNVSELRMNVFEAHETRCQSVVQLPDLRALISEVHNDLARGQQLRIELLLFGAVGADRRHEGPRGDILGAAERRGGGSACHDDAASPKRLKRVPRRLDLSRQAAPDLVGKKARPRWIGVIRKPPLDRADLEKRAELHPPLIPAA